MMNQINHHHTRDIKKKARNIHQLKKKKNIHGALECELQTQMLQHSLLNSFLVRCFPVLRLQCIEQPEDLLLPMIPDTLRDACPRDPELPIQMLEFREIRNGFIDRENESDHRWFHPSVLEQSHVQLQEILGNPRHHCVRMIISLSRLPVLPFLLFSWSRNAFISLLLLLLLRLLLLDQGLNDLFLFRITELTEGEEPIHGIRILPGLELQSRLLRIQDSIPTEETPIRCQAEEGRCLDDPREVIDGFFRLEDGFPGSDDLPFTIDEIEIQREDPWTVESIVRMCCREA